MFVIWLLCLPCVTLRCFTLLYVAMCCSGFALLGFALHWFCFALHCVGLALRWRGVDLLSLCFALFRRCFALALLCFALVTDFAAITSQVSAANTSFSSRCYKCKANSSTTGSSPYVMRGPTGKVSPESPESLDDDIDQLLHVPI